ncbi:hypothetical protein KKG41_02685 [Patescibacteria group bacterium]|nr:hypothetical protein [Patescibacteria group bacterium]MBU1890043.1 hypothetical protein [Patescibacteria group bacterium]
MEKTKGFEVGARSICLRAILLAGGPGAYSALDLMFNAWNGTRETAKTMLRMAREQARKDARIAAWRIALYIEEETQLNPFLGPYTSWGSNAARAAAEKAIYARRLEIARMETRFPSLEVETWILKSTAYSRRSYGTELQRKFWQSVYDWVKDHPGADSREAAGEAGRFLSSRRSRSHRK